MHQKLRTYEKNQIDADGLTLSDYQCQRLESMEKVHEVRVKMPFYHCSMDYFRLQLSRWSQSNRQRGVKEYVEAMYVTVPSSLCTMLTRSAYENNSMNWVSRRAIATLAFILRGLSTWMTNISLSEVSTTTYGYFIADDTLRLERHL